MGKLAQADMLLSAPPGNSATEAEPEVEEVEVIGAGELATLIDRYSLLCFRDRPLSEERRLLTELGERELTLLLPERLELHHVAPPPEVVADEITTEPVDLELGVCYSWSKGVGPCKEEDADQSTWSCWGQPPRPHLCHICWGEHRSKKCDDSEANAKFKKRKTGSRSNMGKDGTSRGKKEEKDDERKDGESKEEDENKEEDGCEEEEEEEEEDDEYEKEEDKDKEDKVKNNYDKHYEDNEKEEEGRERERVRTRE